MSAALVNFTVILERLSRHKANEHGGRPITSDWVDKPSRTLQVPASSKSTKLGASRAIYSTEFWAQNPAIGVSDGKK